MTSKNIYCDYCEKIVVKEDKRIESLHGFTFQVGYSIGGWGKRDDFYMPHSAEICTACFKEVENISTNNFKA